MDLDGDGCGARRDDEMDGFVDGKRRVSGSAGELEEERFREEWGWEVSFM